MLGPVDYIVVGFEGDQFDGSILDELSKAVESGVIRVIDLLFVTKDAEGNVVAGEFSDQPEELKTMFEDMSYEDDTPLLGEEDVETIAADMDNATGAGVLVIEQVWAKGLKKALQDAGGTLLAEGRLHSDKVTAALEAIENISDDEE